MDDAEDTGSRRTRSWNELGILEWIRPGEYDRTEFLIQELGRLGVGRLRTAISWSDWLLPEGPDWYDWLLPRLGSQFELLPCFNYTPPSHAVQDTVGAPPRNPKLYADLLDVLIDRFGQHFEHIELWNEPNNLLEWDWRLDQDWQVFSEMIGGAAYWAKHRGKKTVLGGMCPLDLQWLQLMEERGILAYIDAVGIHTFPGGWNAAEKAPADLVTDTREFLQSIGRDCEVWLTEIGYSTWRRDEAQQVAVFEEALRSGADRIYWYSFQDLDPDVPAQEGFHIDERSYHFGLVQPNGSPKLLHRLMSGKSADAIRRIASLASPPVINRWEATLVTGGAGFVGANLVDRLASQGEQVLVVDSFARDRVEENVEWLADRHRDNVCVLAGDVRDPHVTRDITRGASSVFHLAAQVAVTTSLTDPVSDFEVNLRGTLNLLEGVRQRPEKVPFIFASTNKVYGKLSGRDLREGASRYEPADNSTRAHGIDESSPLDFYSPYGCSKGGADQYVLDYSRIYGLLTAVLRKSCIYGPRQFGTEDQGWVAHFLIATLNNQPITIFGDGRQVRDILFIDDAVDAYLLARQQIGRVNGQAFNIGGGPARATSLLELLDLIEELSGLRPVVRFSDWRPGDQAYYVSDIRKFSTMTGWSPRTAINDGLTRLHQWLVGRRGAPVSREMEAVS